MRILCTFLVITFSCIGLPYVFAGRSDATFYKIPIWLPAKGQVWPAPQFEHKTSDYFVYRLTKFDVAITDNSCDLLLRAVERFKTTINDLYQTLKHRHVGPANHTNKGTLKKLKIRLFSKCEELPHYDMDEKYNLTVKATSELRSESIWGILRGLETLYQLFYFSDDYNEVRINATSIVDYPQYKHRGLLIDTGRHYLSLATIRKTIDAMAMNKMNVLHWHIVDDPSFPYQSERFPTLSEKGAYYSSMVYSKADILSVVAYARDRGVRVTAEIDVPGHTLSWGKAFPGILTECYRDNEVAALGPLDPTKNETYDLLGKLLEEVHHWFPDEFIHVGGDEVDLHCWKSNPSIQAFLVTNNLTINELQAYFMRRVMPLLPKQTRPIVWQEVFDMNALPKEKTHVQVWNWNWITEMDDVLKAGHFVIFSASWYLSYKDEPWQTYYRDDPRQMVYKRRHSAAGLEDIVGGEACMWGEMVDDTNILPKSWPRASAIAERLWTGLAYDAGDPVNDVVRGRIEEHTCRMNRRGIPAQPPNGPGFCVGA